MNRLAGPILRLLPLAAGVAASAWLTVLPAIARAQEEARIEEGTHLFRHILDEKGLRPDREARPWSDTDRKLLIVFGDTWLLGERLGEFVRRGGGVLVATDRNAGQNGTIFGARIQGQPVRVKTGSSGSYRKTKDCIFVQPTERVPQLFQNLTIRNNRLSLVATNRPGYLTLAANDLGRQLEIVAQFPADASIDSRPEGQLGFAAAGEWGKGRILLLADHSVFINAMLAQTDNENYEFAENCVDWLTDNGRRDQVIFYDEGIHQQDFKIPLPELPPPPIESFSMDRLVQATDEAVVGMEEEGVFNDLIFRALGRSWSSDYRDREMLVGSVLIVLTLGLAGFALARLVQARHRFEPGTPLLADAVHQLVPGLSLPQQRQRTLLQQGNFWETARSLTRQCFETLAGAAGSDQQRIRWTDTSSPLVIVQGTSGWWQRRRLRATVDRLWRLAQSSASTRIPLGRLERLKQEIELIHTAVANGRLAIRAPEKKG